jgi:threonine/homoserine/homoserine lactone efflux protein
MATIQLVINIVFSFLFLVWMFGTAYLLYRVWQSFEKLIQAMQETILENARKNVETLGELARVLEKHQVRDGPPS